MAVVFISPRQRQRMFFMGITIMLLLFLGFTYFMVFISTPEVTQQALVFNKPKVTINMDVFNSEMFKGLKDFNQIQNQYSYIITGKDNKRKEGFITASSIDEAKATLEGQGYVVNDLKEADIGRTNPFSPYYQTVTKTIVK